MKFQYFTFFLNPINNLLSLIEKSDKRDKMDILIQVLKKEHKQGTNSFEHRGVKLAHVFKEEVSNYIISSLGRKSTLKRIMPPEEKFLEKKEENWPCCDVIFNLSKDSLTGQRIAFEYKKAIFSNPYEQVKALAEQINVDLMSFGYAIAINPITKEQKFWSIINENKGKIEGLSLTFNAPNLFGLTNSLNDELKEVQKEFNLTKATIEFENPDGKLIVPENTEIIKQGVDYITRGGGEYSVRIKGKGKRVISSKDNIETKSFEFEDLEITSSNPEALKGTLDTIFK